VILVINMTTFVSSTSSKLQPRHGTKSLTCAFWKLLWIYVW